jgi:galactokinase
VVRGGRSVELTSSAERRPARVPLPVVDPRTVEPGWARYVAGVVAALEPSSGAVGRVTTTLPVGAGLSSSAALELAVAMTLGGDALDPEELARLCQRAEHLALGVPCGIMDQLICATGVPGHALMIDCTTLERTPVPIPPDVDVVVVHSGESRALASSAYAERRREVEHAEAVLDGPLRSARPDDLAVLADPVLRRRARHVVTENQRVRQFGTALAAGDLVAAGTLMNESHTSLSTDFEVSTPTLDALAARVRSVPGVFGARITGAGFGGCIVALCEPGAASRAFGIENRIWTVRASAGARRIS